MDEALFLGSNSLSSIAAAAAIQSASVPDEHIVAVFFSVAWLEASLNEIIHLLLRPERIADSPQYNRVAIAARAAKLDGRTASLDLKLQVLCAAATDDSLALGQAPWQHLTLLLDLRNAIVHLRPERVKVRRGQDDEPSSLVTDQDQANDIIKRLLSAGALDSFPQGYMVPILTAAQRPTIGRWSYATVYRVLEQVAEWLPSWREHIIAVHRSPEVLRPAV